MVNRVLIRTKVVQMLYSYLLTRSDFKIIEAPENPSRDQKYAYSTYLGLMLLLIKLNGTPTKRGEVPDVSGIPEKLLLNKVGKSLAANDAIRKVILRDKTPLAIPDTVIKHLLDKVAASNAYKDYSKKSRHSLDEDVTLWITLLETIFAKDTSLIEALRADESFTNAGFDKGVEYVVDTLRSYNDTRSTLVKAGKDLQASLDKAYELYLWLLRLPCEITDRMELRQEKAKSKYLVTSADLNPNTKLTDNALVSYLRSDVDLREAMHKYNKLDVYTSNEVLTDKLLDKILASDLYKDYLADPVTDFAKDVEFWRDAMRLIILPSDELAEDMEDRSVYWNDDLESMGTFVLKSLRRIATSEGAKVEILPQFKDDEDQRFGPDLFMEAVNNREKYRAYIDKFIDAEHWDTERLAFMDIVIMMTAIAEIVKYPEIPVAVSINEYVEIANNYSTDKSGAFVNGVLYSVVQYLKEEGKIFK